MVEELGNVWVEAQIDGSAISLSLMSESSDGVTVEETARYTFGELQEMTGESFSMSLSDDTRDDLSEMNNLAALGDIVTQTEEKSLMEGDIAIDQNPPSWSEDNRVEVVEVLEGTTCEQYVIDGYNEGCPVPPAMQNPSDETVADANPNYDANETVVLAEHTEGPGPNKTYAFPESRLELA